MKKGLTLLSVSFVLLLSVASLKAQTKQVFISFPTGTSPSNPISVCQCDTLGVTPGRPNGIRYSITSPFSPSTQFFYELASPVNNWSSAINLELVGLENYPNAATALDTFATGTYKASLVIPCNAPLGLATFRVRNSNGEISDTVYMNINKIPSKPILDSIKGGYPNPYTAVADWGFCERDSITLFVQPQPGATYQWYIGGALITGAVNDSLVVKSSGKYHVDMSFGACTRSSKDTLINTFKPLTSISLVPKAGVYFIDQGNPVQIFDSIQFCESITADIRAPLDPTGTLTYTYQWITDSIDQFGDTTFYPLVGETQRQLTVDTTGRYYVSVYDGFCTDTSAAFYVFVDTIPKTKVVAKPFPGFSGPIVSGSVCMKDSVLLSSTNVVTGWHYQWQRLNTSINVWNNLVNDTLPTLVVDTANRKPIQPLSFYRLKVNKHTRANQPTCTYTSDTIRVRWFPMDSVRYQAMPFIYDVDNIGQDSINFCATDSALLFGPSTPGQLINNGLNYAYQWLRDSLDTAANQMVRIPIKGETSVNYKVFESGTYYLVIDDGICMDTIKSMHVFVDSIPHTTLYDTLPGMNTDRLLCLTDSVILAARNVILPGWMYQWQQYNSNTGVWQTLTGDTLPGILVDTSYREPGKDTAYFRLTTSYINQFNKVICPFITDSLEVVFFDPPKINFFPGDSLGVCVDDSVLVIAQGNSLNYSWQGGQVIGSSIWLSQPGTYTVTGTGVNGCTTTRQVKIYQLQTTANAGSDITALSGEVVTLTGSGGINYQWSANKPISWSDFLSKSVSVSYTLPPGVKTDTVIITLQVTNGNGCIDTDQLTLIVNADEDPGTSLLDHAWNLFTPNNDGRNDSWDITGIVKDYTVCRIDIMNRWGSIIYNKEKFDGIWDGNDNGGNPLPDGTYYYILSCDGKVILKNAVTLIRNK